MINKIGLILGIIGLILSIFWGAKYYENKRETRELLAQAQIDLVVLEKAAKIRADSILLEVKRRDSAINSLVVAQKEAKESLNETLKLSKSLTIALSRAKATHDTANYYEKCDSLATQVVVLEAENASYQNKVDLLNLNYAKQLSSKDSLLASKDKLYSELRTAFNGSALKINELSNQNTKLEQKLQKSRRTTRLVGLLGVVATGATYLSTR